MSIENKKRWKFWAWIIVAFILGMAMGIVLLLGLLIVIQAMISYTG